MTLKPIQMFLRLRLNTLKHRSSCALRLAIGAIENQSIKKEYNHTVALRKEAVDAFKNLDVTQWLPKK